MSTREKIMIWSVGVFAFFTLLLHYFFNFTQLAAFERERDEALKKGSSSSSDPRPLSAGNTKKKIEALKKKWDPPPPTRVPSLSGLVR